MRVQAIAPQARLVTLFDGRVEGVHVDVNDLADLIPGHGAISLSLVWNKQETCLDVTPRRRHLGSMSIDSKSATVRSLDRINLRLAGETFAAIDSACAARPGNVSRNTWIAEAIEEKLARERTGTTANDVERRAHG